MTHKKRQSLVPNTCMFVLLQSIKISIKFSKGVGCKPINSTRADICSCLRQTMNYMTGAASRARTFVENSLSFYHFSSGQCNVHLQTLVTP
jgi:siroheme synthase (precorrin-2 oxidase/ferrochelatase)